ncbi:MAG: reverse transcriptase domain-containing protein [Candidatus Micrarchaeota archaeon]
MKSYRNLFGRLCDYDNLLLAFKKAKKRKSKKQYVIDFEKNLQNELFKLQWELLTGTYRPRPLTTFTVRDPKTRRISSSHFRDRVVHHAVCNIIEPIFEKRFICDTYANRKGKGTLAALKRFDCFLRKTTKNGRTIIVAKTGNDVIGYALKADIKHYFETVDHPVLISILRKRICDEDLLNLIQLILENHKTEIPEKGMPLGNLTSQFFANVYLGELDYFVKHDLKLKYYVRYVDDFIILEQNRALLEEYKQRISRFLLEKLKVELHQEKSRIIPLHRGITLLGFRVFYHYKLLKKANLNRIEKRILKLKEKLARGETDREHIALNIAGWEGYAKMANTHKLRMNIRKRAKELFVFVTNNI